VQASRACDGMLVLQGNRGQYTPFSLFCFMSI
jgi:hypothetical protein